ncbi:MAG TPA: CsiV family protein [Nevskiaceae bacterium]|nr:CsiV family protein [Nevskiaceae bacterium]
MRVLAPCLTALCLLLAAPLAAAETYRMDVLVFLDTAPPSEGARSGLRASQQGAVAAEDLAGLKSRGISRLAEGDFALDTEWQRLKNSKRFRPLGRYSWTQSDPPTERGPALRVQLGSRYPVPGADGFSVSEVSEVEGSLALLLDRYLQLDADLVYTDREGGQWRLRERRRMKRDERHHLDSPRIGLLARVSRVDGP